MENPMRILLQYEHFCYFCRVTKPKKMKKFLLSALLLCLFTYGYTQPKISDPSFPSSVNLFDLYEIAFQMGNYSNPYDPEVIDVYAEFTAPSGQKYKVNAFYYEDYSFTKQKGYEKANANTKNNGWRVRFTPTLTGTWHFALYAKDQQGHSDLTSSRTNSFTFNCKAVDTGKGFITKANEKYLKRDVVKDGRRQNHSFFPVGPNVAWYLCKAYYDYTTPMGIYEYEKYIDSLSGNANYMRVWLSRYQYLSLYGPEYTQGTEDNPVVYFDSNINQKDAAEFDHILRYATEHGITLMPCIFTFGDFTVKGTDSKGPSKWANNPFHTVLGLKQPHEFFSDREAQRITKNLIRYIVARWGYSPQIMAWELWNEVSNTDIDISMNRYQRKVTKWHQEMADYVRSIDPFNHLVTSSMGNPTNKQQLYENMFKTLDIAQRHNYQNIDKARSGDQFSYILLNLTDEGRALYPTTPFFIGEFGFGDINAETFKSKDPYAVDLHNSLWSSLFSGSIGPASFWYWNLLNKFDLFRIFKPVNTFCEGLPIPSASFTAQITGFKKQRSLVFPNNLETYYMINGNEDTIYGWSQDTAFCYQSLRHLTEKTTKGHFEENATVDRTGYLYTMNDSKKPQPSSNSNTITLPITQQPVGTVYNVRWFDAETGLEMTDVAAIAQVKEDIDGKYLSFEFPHTIRDLKKRIITNTFGDAVFTLTAVSSSNNAEKKPLPTKIKSKRINNNNNK